MFMSFVFNATKSKKIYIAQGERENVRLAVNDLMKDIQRVCGGAVLTEIYDDADIVVASKQSVEFVEISAGKVAFTKEEEFCYRIENSRLYLFGADDLGTMWAIYAFAENELKIPPFYIFEDI